MTPARPGRHFAVAQLALALWRGLSFALAVALGGRRGCGCGCLVELRAERDFGLDHDRARRLCAGRLIGGLRDQRDGHFADVRVEIGLEIFRHGAEFLLELNWWGTCNQIQKS